MEIETLDNDKELINNINAKSKETKNNIEELLIYYEIECCSPQNIIFILLCFLFPFFFLIYLFGIPHKRVIIIDKNKNMLTHCEKAIVSCCIVGYPFYYGLDNIKKIRIYTSSSPDPNFRFNKLYFINCKIYSKNDQEENLFMDIPYNKELFDRYVSFFKKYFITEVEPLEITKDKYKYNLNEGENNPISDEDELPQESELITKKPSTNFDAPLPV